jgi:hypothetical protein
VVITRRDAEVKDNERPRRSLRPFFASSLRHAASSFVDGVSYLLFAFKQARHGCCTPRYLSGLVRKALRKVEVILLHDVEHRFLGEVAMVGSQ